MTIQTTPTTTFFGLRQKPQASLGHHRKAAQPACRPASYSASGAAPPDRLLEGFIFGFFRSGVRAAFYLACAHAAKIALGMGYLSFALR
jgi:hypothetical protein